MPLPRLSSWQNLHYANQIVSSYLKMHEKAYQPTRNKIFLTTERKDRIMNIECVELLFSQYGYQIINPANLKPQELLCSIKNAKYLFSEQGSIHQNVLIARSTPYYLFLSLSAKYQTPLEHFCGGKYSMYHWPLINPVWCEDRVDERNLHPYSRPISVDIHSLSELLKSMHG